jgi:hypothetical protein
MQGEGRTYFTTPFTLPFHIYGVNSVPSSSRARQLSKSTKNRVNHNKKTIKHNKNLNKNKNIKTNTINIL